MSKYCKRCNAEIDDTIVFCPYCGYANVAKSHYNHSKTNNRLRIAAKVFMILGCIGSPLLTYFIGCPCKNRYRRDIDNAHTAALVHTDDDRLLEKLRHRRSCVQDMFVIVCKHYIAGILMLCDNTTY